MKTEKTEKTEKTGSIQFAADHEHVNQDSKPFLPQYRLQVNGVQNQYPDPHRMSVAGTQKKAPRFSERSVVPEGENIVLKSVFSLSTLRALSAETSENARKTSETMGGMTTVSPLLFMNNLQKLISEANRNNYKKRLLNADASGVADNASKESNNKPRSKH